MTRNLMKPWLSASLRRLFSGQDATTGRRDRRRRRSRAGLDVQGPETLEGRVVPAAWAWGGGSLVGTLSGVGVVTGPVVPGPVLPIPRGMTPASATVISQLQTDWKALVTELQGLAAKSGVTVADLESLALDSQAIGQAGFHFTASSLHTVISELATAVAGGASTSQAQSDWSALFTSSSVSNTVVTNTFNDLVTVIQDSHVTTTDLTTVAGDEAAIQTDLSNLGKHLVPASVAGMGPAPLLATDPLPSLAVTLPNLPASTVAAVQSIVNSLPVVSQPLILSPGISSILPWGVNLLGSLTHVGAVTGPVVAPQQPLPASTQSTKFQQLITDEQALRTELQSLAAKSGVTVAELQSLALDSQSISQAGAHVSSSALSTVISELATAVAGGASTSQALSDWTALFSSTSVSTTVVTNTFNDLAAAIGSSKVTTTDLTTVANDEAAIQTDLKNLASSKGGGTGSGTSPGGTTGTKHSKPSPVVNKPAGTVILRKALINALHKKVLNALRRKG
ncbi:MAG: hypothetical protein ACLQIB_47045 [Isosphaeraceae bacterium]